MSSRDHGVDMSKNFFQFIRRHSEISLKSLGSPASSCVRFWYKHLAQTASLKGCVPSVDAFVYVFLITAAVSKTLFLQYFETASLLPSFRAGEDLIMHLLDMMTCFIQLSLTVNQTCRPISILGEAPVFKGQNERIPFCLISRVLMLVRIFTKYYNHPVPINKVNDWLNEVK